MPHNTAASTTAGLCRSWWLCTLLPPPLHLHCSPPVPQSPLPVPPALHCLRGFAFPTICYILRDSSPETPPQLKQQCAWQSKPPPAEAKGARSRHDGSPVLRTKGEVARGTGGSRASSRTSHHHCQFWRNSSRLPCNNSKTSSAVAAQSSLEGKKLICTKPLLQLFTESRITGARKSEL